MLSSYQFDQSVAVRLPAQSDADTKALLQLVKSSDMQRASIEQFIAAGFAKAYEADVHKFMPNLLGVSRAGEWQAVLGLGQRCSCSIIYRTLPASSCRSVTCYLWHACRAHSTY